MTESLRETVVGGALDLLERDGLNLSYDSISYSKVFGYLQSEYGLRVTRGSVHERIWNGQDDFRQDVLASSVRHFPTGYLSSTLLEIAREAEGPEAFAIDIGARSFRTIWSSQRFGQFQSVKALASRFEDLRTTAVLRGELNKWAVAEHNSRRRSFPLLLAELGLQVRTDLGLSEREIGDVFFSLVESLSDGGHLNHHSGSQNISAPIRFGTSPTDGVELWCAMSIGVKSFVDALCEEASGPFGIPDKLTARGPPEVHALVVEELRAVAERSTRSRQELRQLILDAAVEVLLRDGLDLKADSLTYAAVFAYIEKSSGLVIHRRSVHPRFWTSNEEFRLEVLARSLLVAAHPQTAVAEPFETPPQARNPDGSIHRRQTAHDVIRTVTDSFARVAIASDDYRRLLQAKAALLDQPGSVVTTFLRATVQETDRDGADRNKILVQQNLLDLGFIVRPETGLAEEAAIELFVGLLMTSNSGTTLNELAGIATANQPHRLARLDGPGRDAWTSSGIAMRSYFDQLYEERLAA